MVGLNEIEVKNMTKALKENATKRRGSLFGVNAAVLERMKEVGKEDGPGAIWLIGETKPVALILTYIQ